MMKVKMPAWTQDPGLARSYEEGVLLGIPFSIPFGIRYALQRTCFFQIAQW